MNASDIDLTPASANERRAVGMAATAAFYKMCQGDPSYLPHMMHVSGWPKSRILDDWRHSQVKFLTAGRARRTSELTHRDAGPVLAAFAAMAGQDVKAFNLYIKNGPAPGKAGASGDDQNALRQWRHKIAAEGPGFGFNSQWQHGYVTRVFKNAGVRSLDDCTAAQLKSLYITMRSRWLERQRAPQES